MKKHILFTFLTTALAASAVQSTNVANTMVDTRNYTLAVRADNGDTTPPDGDHFYAWRSTVPCTAAAENNGWLFTGWSGDATTDQTGTNITVLLDTVYKAVIANYSDDPDNDGLKNTNEWASGANPWLADTDGDGFGDKLEVDHSWNPAVSDLWAINHIRDNGSTFDLYASNAVLDVAFGDLLVETAENEATLSLQFEISDDLETWTNAGDAKVWTWTIDSEKKFFRVRAGR